MSHDITVTKFSVTFAGEYTAPNTFNVTGNEVRTTYVSNSDSRFVQGAYVELPKIGDDGSVSVAQVQLTSDQVAQFQSIITAALTTVDFDPEFGPAPAPPAE